MLSRLAKLVRPSTTVIRPIKKEELTLFDEWTIKYGTGEHVFAGTNRTLTEACYTYDPDGFLIAVNEKDEPLGLAVGCKMDDRTAFVGRLLVRPDLRGQGIGDQLIKACIKYVGTFNKRNTHINCTLDSMDSYKKRGAAHKVFEMAMYSGIPNIQNQPFLSDMTQIDVVHNEDFPALVNYDEGIHVIRREQFLSKLFGAEDVTLLAAKAGVNIVGYGCSYRTGQQSYGVGPVFADNIILATRLMDNLLNKIEPGSTVNLFVPVLKNGTEELLESMGFRCFLKLARMSTCNATDTPLQYHKVFAATTAQISLI